MAYAQERVFGKVPKKEAGEPAEAGRSGGPVLRPPAADLRRHRRKRAGNERQEPRWTRIVSVKALRE